MRGAPAWHRRHSVQHPSTVSALRADPPSPTRGEGNPSRKHSRNKIQHLRKTKENISRHKQPRGNRTAARRADAKGWPDNATTFDRMDRCRNRHFSRHACGRTVERGSGGYPERILQPARSST
ncbi:hypothetical protein FJ930_15865 [Mesorhizobium sp. B2-4-15]|nr:hypothetical protein FJ930_15865 [Mesorhizobium sp. B2-4-15]